MRCFPCDGDKSNDGVTIGQVGRLALCHLAGKVGRVAEATYRNLILTEEFGQSLLSPEPPMTDEELDGVVDALDDLDANPAAITRSNRLHLLDRELDGWWSLTPENPPESLLRILMRPEQVNGQGAWRIGPVTRPYRR